MERGSRPDWAVRLARLRAERRWSHRDLAYQIRLAARRREDQQVPNVEDLTRNIRRWESGRNRPDERYSALLAAVYRAPALAQPDWSAAHPDASGRLAAGYRSRPDAAAVGAVTDLVHHYRLADDTAPTGSLREPVDAVARLAEDLAGAATTDRQQRAAGRAVAEAERQRWWVLTDLGRHDEASAAHARAVAAAVETGYLPFVGFLLASRAAVALSRGELPAAIRLARQSRDARWGTTPAGRAWAATQEVRAHLAAGSPPDDLAPGPRLGPAGRASAACDRPAPRGARRAAPRGLTASSAALREALACLYELRTYRAKTVPGFLQLADIDEPGGKAAEGIVGAAAGQGRLRLGGPVVAELVEDDDPGQTATPP